MNLKPAETRNDIRMEFYQIIVTSSAETLDGSSGFGMVACDKRLGEDIRRLALGWGYPESLQGQPAYAYRVDKEHVIMNRTVPVASDHTGRRHYLSHTFAAPSAKVRAWLASRPGNQLTPAEVMLGLPWRDSWEGKPRWMDSSTDGAINPDSIAVSAFEPVAAREERVVLLLAHESREGTTAPRKLIWEGCERNTTGLLHRFHEAWMVIDPWRGDRSRAGDFNQPASPLSDSWECTFTIALRGSRPDDFTWIHYAPGEETGSQRQRFDCTNLERVSDRLRERFGELGGKLKDRALNADEWWSATARAELQKSIDELEERARRDLLETEHQLGSIKRELSQGNAPSVATTERPLEVVGAFRRMVEGKEMFLAPVGGNGQHAVELSPREAREKSLIALEENLRTNSEWLRFAGGCRSQIISLREQLQTLSGEKGQLEREVNQLRSSLSSDKLSMDQRIRDLEGKNAQQESIIGTIRQESQKAEAFKKKHPAYLQWLLPLLGVVVGASGMAIPLILSGKSQQAEIEKIKRENNTTNYEKENLNKQIATLEADRKTLEGSQKNQTGELGKLKAAEAQNTENLAAATKETERLKKEAADKSAESEKAAKERDELKKENVRLTTELDKAKIANKPAPKKDEPKKDESAPKPPAPKP